MPPRKKRVKRVHYRWLSNLEIHVQKMSISKFVGWASALFVGLGIIMQTSGFLISFALAWWTSGPMPYPSRAELEILKSYTAMQQQNITEQLQKLDTRQQQSMARGAIVAENLQQLNISQMQAKIAEAEAEASKNPNNEAARKLLLTYREQLENLESMYTKLQN